MVLKQQASREKLMAFLKDLADGNHAKAAKDASQLIVSSDGIRQPHALTLLQCAASRVQDVGTVGDAVSEVLAKHPLHQTLTEFLEASRQKFIDHSFMLRAMPLHRVQMEESKQENTGEQEAETENNAGAGPTEKTIQPDDAQKAEVTVAPPAQKEEPMRVMEKDGDCEALAQLELLQAKPLLRNICGLKFHWHDITRFKFYDLQQICVPDLAQDDDNLGASSTSLGQDGDLAPEKQGSDDEKKPDDWATKEAENQESRKQGFVMLQKLLPILARAAVYSSAKERLQLLQTVLVAALNALLIVAPTPSECVPRTGKADPQDIDATAPPATEAASREPDDPSRIPMDKSQTVEPDNDMWLNLAILAHLAVDNLLKLQRSNSEVHVRAPKGGTLKRSEVNASASAEEGPAQAIEDKERIEEARVIRVARDASKAMEAADEELHEIWFEKMPELDIVSIGKLVAFAVLCLYQMRRWTVVIRLSRRFNEATCSMFATTFIPLAIGAQHEVCALSARSIANTERYLQDSKKEYDIEQKKLATNNRRLLRQLTLKKEQSEPEKLYNRRKEYYEGILKRQKTLREAWELFLKTLEASLSLASRAVPAAMEQLRLSRIHLASFLDERRIYNTGVKRGTLPAWEKVGAERQLKLKSISLIALYRKSVELLRKRQLIDQVVQALHELGNLQWLEGDIAGARTSWSDAVDAAFQYVYAIKNWQKCVETAVVPPTSSARAQLMLLSLTILRKHAQMTMPDHSRAHLNAALFASEIVEAVLAATLPHPLEDPGSRHRPVFPRVSFAPDKYRMREIFFGLREFNGLLPPSSVHGGLDGLTFLDTLSFFYNTLHMADYQTARCIPMCSLYSYVAADVCRNRTFTIRGGLMTARCLIKTQQLTSAWLSLHAVARGYGAPSEPPSLLGGEVLDQLLVEVQEAQGHTPFRCDEPPFSEVNKQAVGQLIALAFTAENVADMPDARLARHNSLVYRFAQLEFIVCACTNGRVFSKVNDQEETDRKMWLVDAETKLRDLWKDVTGNADDLDTWSAALHSLQQEHLCNSKATENAVEVESNGGSKEKDQGSDAPMLDPASPLTQEESDLCVDARMLLSRVAELRGDLERAILEVMYAMHFVRLLASTGVRTGTDCSIGAGGKDLKLRTHPGMKSWMALRRRIVQLLASQGRLAAAEEHIEQGLKECSEAHDELSRIDLLATRVRVDSLNGRLLENHGEKRIGAVPTAEQCVNIARKNLPTPTVSAVLASMLLCLLQEQNPAFADIRLSGKPASVMSEQSGQVAPVPMPGKVSDPNVQMLLEAQNRVITSPIAKDLQDSMKGAERALLPKSHVADMLSQCMHDLDELLEAQCFDLQPRDMNFLLHIGRGDDSKETHNLPLLPLPPWKCVFRQRLESDSREPPNIYLELMPLRFHCELILARVQIELGRLELAGRLLQEAEVRMARCVHLVPWFYVQFCILKLKWWRLQMPQAGKIASPDKQEPHEKYRGPRAFADGICPPTDSPVFRTFLRRSKAPPPLTFSTMWIPQEARTVQEDLSIYLKEVQEVMKIAVHVGGHDHTQLQALLREGLEEVLRVRHDLPEEPDPQHLIYAFFSLLVAVTDLKKACHFEVNNTKPTPGQAQAPVDGATLPARIGHEIQQGLRRQAWEGALGYSESATQDSKIPLQLLQKYAFALRRECSVFSNLFQSERMLCDQLHVSLLQVEHYKKSKALDASLIATLETPPEMPRTGDLLIHWMEPDVVPIVQHGNERSDFLVLICPRDLPAEHPQAQNPHLNTPLVARGRELYRDSIRRLYDGLCNDLDHCKPAAAVSRDFMKQRLQTVSRVIGGGLYNTEIEGVFDPDVDNAMKWLLLTLAPGEATEQSTTQVAGSDMNLEQPPEHLDAEKVGILLQALVRMLEWSTAATRVCHPELSSFLRIVMDPWQA